MIFTCSDEIGLEIILWQYDLHNKEKTEHLLKKKKTKRRKTRKQHLGVPCITSHRSITVLHFDISNLWLSNIQLRQSRKKENNGSIIDKSVRNKKKQENLKGA